MTHPSLANQPLQPTRGARAPQVNAAFCRRAAVTFTRFARDRHFERVKSYMKLQRSTRSALPLRSRPLARTRRR
jgi:hypothetical protein